MNKDTQPTGDLTDERIKEAAREGERRGRAVIDNHLQMMETNRHYRERIFNAIVEHDAKEGLHRFVHLAGHSQATKAQAVPEGFALVPIEPTQEMFAAARTSTPGSNTEKLLMANYWRNMLAAAPTAQEVTQQAAPDLHMIQLRLKQILNPALGQLSAQWMAADALYYLTKDDSFADIADSLMTQQAAKAETAEQAKPELTVWESAMPESNGKSNFTAVLHRKDSKGFDLFTDGFQFARSEYPDRVRYEADFMRWLIGERAERPELWDDCYDMDKHSGYVAPTTSTVSASDEKAVSDVLIDAALEAAAQLCDRFADRDMHPAECAGAIRMMKRTRTAAQAAADAEKGQHNG